MSHKKKPYSAWKTFDAEMWIDPRFTRAVYPCLGIAVLLSALYVLGGPEIFMWLAYLSIAVLIIIIIVGLIVKNRNRF